MAVVPLGGDGTVPAISTQGKVSTDGEQAIFINSQAKATTVTLSSDDCKDGFKISIIDRGGKAGTNAITVDTEGGEDIEGSSSITLSSDYAAVTLTSNGTNWLIESRYRPVSGSGGGGGGGVSVEEGGTVVVDGATAINAGANLTAVDDGDGTVTVDATTGPSGPSATVEGSGSDTVNAGDNAVLAVDELADGETLSVTAATLVSGTVEAVPTGVDLQLGTFSGGTFTSKTTIVAGDGSAVHDNASGSPLASYQNTSGSAQTVGYVIYNGAVGTVTVVADATGEIT